MYDAKPKIRESWKEFFDELYGDLPETDVYEKAKYMLSANRDMVRELNSQEKYLLKVIREYRSLKFVPKILMKKLKIGKYRETGRVAEPR